LEIKFQKKLRYSLQFKYWQHFSNKVFACNSCILKMLMFDAASTSKLHKRREYLIKLLNEMMMNEMYNEKMEAPHFCAILKR
jgi:hypothetical protein